MKTADGFDNAALETVLAALRDYIERLELRIASRFGDKKLVARLHAAQRAYVTASALYGRTPE